MTTGTGPADDSRTRRGELLDNWPACNQENLMIGMHQFSPRGFSSIKALALTALLLARATFADQAAVPEASTAAVDDFTLLDQHGHAHQLRRPHGARAVVLMIAGNGCPIVRQNAAKLKTLRDQFPKVRFWMLNPNAQDDRATILAEANEFDISLPILKDETQMVARSLGVERTAEVIAIDTKNWSVFYRGALDDQMVQGAVKAAVREPHLENALRAFLEGKKTPVARTTAAGCLVRYDWALPGPADQISYARHVAPILQRRCVSCHSTGNIGPFALSSYSRVRGFSAQIREEILTQRMPPWSADPHYGAFEGDRALTPAESQTLIRWIDAGTPRGHGDDPLAQAAPEKAPRDGWELGRPDYVVPISEKMHIPATGVVDYITNIVDCPIPADAWLKGAVIRPDNRKVLHHVIVYLEYPPGHPQSEQWEQKWLVGWAPGATQSFYPAGTGKFLPKGGQLRFQLHYTPYGKEAWDQTELGLYLHEQPPQVELQMRGVLDANFSIPPHTRDARTLAILDFPRDTLVYELSPHMHKRGSWFRYEALFPDGSYETLLSVPRFNFNWQHTYRLAQPRLLPAGTRILCSGGFDNSKYNPDNPDPGTTVRWGDQSFEEMFIGFMTVSPPLPQGATAAKQARLAD